MSGQKQSKTILMDGNNLKLLIFRRSERPVKTSKIGTNSRLPLCDALKLSHLKVKSTQHIYLFSNPDQH